MVLMNHATALAQLRQTFTGYWSYLPLYSACELGLLELLVEKKQSAAQLCQQLKAHAPSLQLLLEALVELEILSVEAIYYDLTPKGALLTETHPQSVKYSCLLWAMEHLTAWQQLPHSILTGNTAFEQHYGLPFFDYLRQQPRARHIYYNAMAEYARDDYASIGQFINFGAHQSVLDVGGGLGTLLLILRKQWPALSLSLLDLPEVVAMVPPATTQEVKIIGGDFFDAIPKGSDALVLARILHDWEDAKVLQILTQAHQALPVGGSLYILENLKEELKDGAKLLSLNMLLICKSHERSLDDYCRLIHQVGFTLEAVQSLPSVPTLLHFKK